MGNFIFCCPHCNQKIEADESMRGEFANCPCCNEEIVVDELSPWEDDVVAKDGSCNLSETIAVEKKQVQNDKQPIEEEESFVENNNEGDFNQSVEIKESFPDKKKSKSILIFVLIAIAFLFLAGGISFILYQQRQAEAQRQAECQKRLKEFATFGHELQNKAGLGVSYRELGDLVAKIDSKWRILCEVIPEKHEGRLGIDNALKSWRLCYTIWGFKIGDRYSKYLHTHKLSIEDKNFLLEEICPLDSFLPFYEYDKWISILLAYANVCYIRGYDLLSGKKEKNLEKDRKLALDLFVQCKKKISISKEGEVFKNISFTQNEDVLWRYIYAMGRLITEGK